MCRASELEPEPKSEPPPQDPGGWNHGSTNSPKINVGKHMMKEIKEQKTCVILYKMQAEGDFFGRGGGNELTEY